MPDSAAPSEIVHLAGLLRAGGLVAFPTETVYGLGADATSSDAVLRIYETKGRPRFNPLIVHCADRAMAERLGIFPPLARRLADAFWPGPLTLVVQRRSDAHLSDLVTAGLDTVGLRIPAHPLAQALLRATGLPLAAPSANPSGRLSPTTAEQVREAFQGLVQVLDGGACAAGLESTILSVDGDRVTQLRAGALPRAEIEAVIGQPVMLAAENAAIAAPGMLASHYAPAARLRLDAAAPASGEAFLAFGPQPPAIGPTRNLSPAGDLAEAARNLFSMLHELDREAAAIAVAPIPEIGLGEAINDRLRRAAAPRP
ncbi:MAG TPA: L-threonylcarbamoyladenylate synthase [Devosiaceae bacterium]|jgi:L-threonylcarbamoyladenylate synthase|nr:L-threonylcarbamoyladenylate synthase [Devosiaceae bacterium]